LFSMYNLPRRKVVFECPVCHRQIPYIEQTPGWVLMECTCMITIPEHVEKAKMMPMKFEESPDPWSEPEEYKRWVEENKIEGVTFPNLDYNESDEDEEMGDDESNNN